MLQAKLPKTNARAAHNAAIRRFNKEERKSRQEQIQKLVACHREWKAQRSAPFEYLGRTFDVIVGSLELCDALFEGLFACLTGLQDGIAAKLDELDQLEARYGDVARLDQCLYGSLVASEREGVNRAGHAQDGWRHGGDRVFELGSLSFGRVIDPLAYGDTRAVSGRDRTVAVHAVLRDMLLAGRSPVSEEDVYKLADNIAVQLARARDAGKPIGIVEALGKRDQ